MKKASLSLSALRIVEEALRRLTGEDEDFRASYSPGGRWLCFTSNHSRRMEIWKMPAEGEEPVQSSPRCLNQKCY